jgi:bacterioferritin-associated ferredoxin
MVMLRLRLNVNPPQTGLPPGVFMDSCCQSCQDCSDRFVCSCLRVTETALVEALTTLPIRNLRELRQLTGAGEGCTCCHVRLQQYIDHHTYASSPICSVK